jgi:TatA/E family protein of Tat protein translocase
MDPLFVILLLDGVGTGELLVILLAVFILFGPNKIPEIAKGLAKGIRDIKNASEDIQKEVNKTIDPIKKELQDSVGKIKDELNLDEKKNTATPDKKTAEEKSKNEPAG